MQSRCENEEAGRAVSCTERTNKILIQSKVNESKQPCISQEGDEEGVPLQPCDRENIPEVKETAAVLVICHCVTNQP